MPPTDVQRQIMRRVVRTFLDSGKPTSRDDLLREFQNLNDLNNLVWQNLFKSYSPGSDPYFPTAWAFHYCGDTDAENTARKAVQTLAVVLRLQYLSALVDLSRKGLLEGAQHVDATITPKDIELGIYLAAQMNLFQSYLGDSPQLPQIEPKRISEYIVEVKTPFTFWDDFMARSNPWPEVLQVPRATLRFPDRLRTFENEDDPSEDIDDALHVLGKPVQALTRDQKIGIGALWVTGVGVLVTVIGIYVSVTTPELRRFFGLDKEPAAVASAPSSTPPTSTTETGVTHDQITAEVAHVVTPEPVTAKRVTWKSKANWRLYLKVGMTEDQVRDLFGNPDHVTTDETIDTWYYGDIGGGTIGFEKGELYTWDEPD